MRASQDMRVKVLRVFYILRGLFHGATQHKNFALLFDWLYPEYFGIVKKCLTVYIEPVCDDNIVLLIFKFLHELVDNSSSRLRFDTWSINGLIVYKESASFMVQFMGTFGCLGPQNEPGKKFKAIRHNDQYKEVYRFLKVLMGMLEKCIQGNYINFAICEYYNDNTFTQVS
jgi:exportin-7